MRYGKRRVSTSAISSGADKRNCTCTGRVAVCLFVRDEARDIAEWLAFQFAVGFDACIVYDNGSVDGTRDIARAFRRQYDIRLIDWPHTTRMAQCKAYDDCLHMFGGEFEWVGFIDADELIVPGVGDIKALVARHEAASAIVLNWAMFGSSGHQHRPPGLMIETFTRRACDSFRYGRSVKSIVRPRDAIEAVTPHFFSVRGPTCTAGGHTLTLRKPGVTPRADLSIAQVSHFFTRSRAEWDWKRQRGYRGRLRGLRLDHTFQEFDCNEIEDRKALRFAPAVRTILQAMGIEIERADVTA